jgi:Dolichyl-phosphate-mannose-protein mannosyltransferase
MAVALAVIACLASGYVVVVLGWPMRSPSSYCRLIRASLSAGFGVGVFSVIFLFARELNPPRLLAIDVLVIAALAAAFLLTRSRARPIVIGTMLEECIALPRWLRHILTASFAFAVAAALYSAVLRSIVHPHGEGWDAFAIWNLHARFLFRGGQYWRDGFSSLIPWSHPDYPLLLPSAIAHFWSALGHESTAVPAVIGLVFTFGTLGLLFSSLAVLRGRTAAMLAGLALVSTPFFVEQGSAQYADVPLSFFFLAVMVLLHLDGQHRIDSAAVSSSGLLVLAGIAAGFAMWTKNEGILFLGATILAHLFVRAQRRRFIFMFLPAVAPLLIFVGWFKHSIAFRNELFSNQSNSLHKVLDPSRYGAILGWFVKDFFRFGEWWLVPGTLLLVIFFFLVVAKRRPQTGSDMEASILTLILTLAGYFAIYVITPYDLYWHLRFSLNRLFLQLWPCALFLFFLAVPTEMGEKSRNRAEFAEN